MLKVAFPSFKISKFSGRELPQNPLPVSVSGTCLLSPPPPQYKIHSAVPVSRSREIHKNTKTKGNLVEILPNTCLYNIFETYFSYRGYLLAVNLQIHLGTSSLKRANNVPKLPGVDYVVKKWALAMMLKALPLVHFWSILLLKEQMMTSLRKTLKMLVWSAQNRSISSKICPENNHKIGRFLPIAFGEVCPKNSHEIPAKWVDFSANLSLKIPQNLAFSSATYQKPWVKRPGYEN